MGAPPSWTEERSDEGRRRVESARRRAGKYSGAGAWARGFLVACTSSEWTWRTRSAYSRATRCAWRLRRLDCPEEPRLTGSPFRGWLTVGWDGDPREVWLAAGQDGDGARRPVLGWYRLELPERENQDRANLDLFVHPAERRRGLGTALLRHAAERAAGHGRSVLAGATRDGTPGAAFARSAGAEPGVVEVQRMLEIGKLADGSLERLREQAERSAAALLGGGLDGTGTRGVHRAGGAGLRRAQRRPARRGGSAHVLGRAAGPRGAMPGARATAPATTRSRPCTGRQRPGRWRR